MKQELEVAMNLGEKIKYIRKEKGLTQRELGKKIGIHEKNIGAYEKGSSVPSSDVLKKMSIILDVTADYLLNENVKRPIMPAIEDHELLEQFQKADKLNDGDRFVIKRIIKAILRDNTANAA